MLRCRWPGRRRTRIRAQAWSDLRDAEISKDRRPILLDDVRGRREAEPHAVAAKRPTGGLFFHGEIAVRQAFGE